MMLYPSSNLVSRFFLLLTCIVVLNSFIYADAISVPFNRDALKVITGFWNYRNETVSVNKQLFDSNAGCGFGQSRGEATFDLRDANYDWFIGYIGTPDGMVVRGSSGSIIIESDDKLLLTMKYSEGKKAQPFKIPLKGCKSLTIKIDSGGGCFLNPELIKGNPATTTGNNQTTIDCNNQSDSPATFVIDPNDLEKLSLALRRRVDGKPEIKAKLASEKGFMAVMTFNLIDIPSPSVAQNVAEDLATKLINADFRLVERGQLDKAVKELKIQDSAMIDQATAQKLGQITGCSYILVGSVSDRGQFIVMNARILETATGQAVVADSVECRKIPIQR